MPAAFNFVEGFAVSMFGLAVLKSNRQTGRQANRLAVLQTDWFSVILVRCSVLLKVMLLLMKKVAA